MVAPRDHLLQSDQTQLRQRLAAKFKRRHVLPDTVEDITQDLVLQLLMAEGTFQPERGDWAGYSCAVSLQHLRQRHRRHQAARGRQETQLERPDWLLDDRPVDDDLRLDVEQVLLRLPEDLVRIARMLMLHNLTQAARELAMPRSSLQVRVQELRNALRRLQPEG